MRLLAISTAFCFTSDVYAENEVVQPHWVVYTQKGIGQTDYISPAAWQRRSTRAILVDFTRYDTPVSIEYILQTQAAGVEIRSVSRWLNAVSVTGNLEALERVRCLPFVAQVRPVASFRREVLQAEAAREPRLGKVAAFDYGPSYFQVAMLGIDSLHNSGLTGHGLLIGIMDTGFDTSHVAFDSLRAGGRIVATRDFLNGDTDVMDNWGGQRSHGTAVHSILGGFVEAELIGTAFGADFALAKTESVLAEIRAEEDHWIAAAEWMESLGVDIITSSLGYTDWYDTTQLDGDTPLITRAADIAVSLGVMVVNAAGNEGNNPAWRKVTPPADGDSVFAVGGVDINGEVTGFSSRGPTADGRIKPDFCALGSGVYVANYFGGYATMSGTSFSTPLIAGGIALMLEAHPEWNYLDIVQALRLASSNGTRPNNQIGWGIPDFVSAVNRQPHQPGAALELRVTPQPAVDSAVIWADLPRAGEAVLSIHDVSGEKIIEWHLRPTSAMTMPQSWDGRNERGEAVASGVYICVLQMGDEIVRRKLAYVRTR
jgi:subtilisin family serine protease